MKIKIITGIFIMIALLCLGCEAPEEPKTPEQELPVIEEEEEETPEGAAPDPEYLILVNKTQGLDKEYKPDDLSDIKYFAADRGAEGRFMRVAAADAFHSMAEEAEKQGIELVITTAYRSYSFQATLYNNYVARDGQAAADRYSAKPGYSEHQTGLAADISSASVGYRLTAEFAGTAEGKWLSENAHLFGFIIRYPEGKEDITGYQYEPWHIRYVGNVAAAYIHENEIILEEYLKLLEKETEE